MKSTPIASDRAAEAYGRGEYAKAMLLLDEVIEESPYSPHGLGSRHLRALAYESGRAPSGQSLERALSDFEFLAGATEVVGSVGMVGMARVLGELDIRANAETMIELCSRATELDAAPEAAIVMGDVHAFAYGNEREARRWYRRAYRAGEGQGLIKVATSYEREGKRMHSAMYALRYLFRSLVRRTSGEERDRSKKPI